MNLPFALLDEPAVLADYQGWRRDEYEDLMGLQRGTLSEADFNAKYRSERAILSMDMTGFTMSAMHRGELESLLRILDAQKVGIPALVEAGAELVRCFADDIVAIFADPHAALDAAFEVHRRIRVFNDSPLASEHPTRFCAGLGFGRIFRIGPNLAQGDEMNRASKLGEDIARGNETLLTERAFAALCDRDDVHFEAEEHDDKLFPFYRATPR
ncbi:MAG: hypothetical protein R3176_02575 [Woeseiaceae bacterium]|nr:hypothetical protein [Woeseiaceae bacterium]